MVEQLEIIQATLEDAIEILALQKLAYQSEARIYDVGQHLLYFRPLKRSKTSLVHTYFSKPSASIQLWDLTRLIGNVDHWSNFLDAGLKWHKTSNNE